MDAIIMKNSTDPATPVISPRKDDGSLYRYAMLFDGYESIAFADTLTDMTAVLLGSTYYTLDPAAALAARADYLNSVQVWTQAMICADDRFDFDNVTIEENAILMGSRDTQPQITEWRCAVPLVLVTTGYAPHTDVALPVAVDPGEIIWLDPDTEDQFLRSLASVDHVTLAESD